MRPDDRRVPRTTPARLPFAFAIVLVPTFLLPGCIERALLIRSDPPGARVFIDGKDAGTTPARVPFEFYGTREVMVKLEESDDRRGERSYAPQSRFIEVSAPWYQWFPLDLVTEFVWPWTIRDEHVVDFVLEPRTLEEWQRAYRERAHAEGIRFPTDPPPNESAPAGAAPTTHPEGPGE